MIAAHWITGRLQVVFVVGAFLPGRAFSRRRTAPYGQVEAQYLF